MVTFDNSKLVKDEYQRLHLANLLNGDHGDVLMQYTGIKTDDGKEIEEDKYVMK